MGIWFDRLNFRNKKLENSAGSFLLLPKKVTNERELGWARRFYLLSQPWENLLLRVPKPSLLTSYFVFKEPAFLSDEWYFGFHWQLRLIAWERSNVIGLLALKNKAFPARAMLIRLQQTTRAFTPTRAKKRKNGTLVHIKAIFHDNYITLTPFNARDLKSTWQISDTFHQAIAYEVDIIRIILTTFYFTLLWRKGYSEELKPGVVRTTWANWL